MSTSSASENLTSFPPFEIQGKNHTQARDQHDSPIELGFGTDTADNSAMAGTSSPYIKSEPNDFFDPNQFVQFNQNGAPRHHQFTSSSGHMNLDPANLQNGNNAMSQSFGQLNMSSSFNLGSSGIADDELLDLQLDQGNQQSNNFDFNTGVQNFLNTNLPMNQQQPNVGMFSQTPDGQPIQSPFTHDFNYAQFRAMPGQQPFAGGHSLPQQAGYRPHMQQIDRRVSDSRSPASPHHLQIGEQLHPPMQQVHHQRQQGSIGGNEWDSTPSGHSWNESSPFPSPVNGHPMNRQISEVLTNTTHHHKVASSLPTKMEGGPAPAFQSQEAKRRRRRESHNMVERRRRDNINERIHDLGTLVPQHRLEDEKVRKHLQTNAPLSPSIANATGISPPNAATSLLAGGQGRRANGSGSITQGLPIEEKDKGPNKGDILNGSVAWTRDLMWYMQLKLHQVEEAKNLLQQQGQAWPFEESEEEKRMSSEIWEVLSKHAGAGGFSGYSRAPGSGLRVPGFTNVAGDSVNAECQVVGNGQGGSSGISPGFQSGGSGMSSGHQQHHYSWDGDFKEEDEYGLEMQ